MFGHFCFTKHVFTNTCKTIQNCKGRREPLISARPMSTSRSMPCHTSRSVSPLTPQHLLCFLCVSLFAMFMFICLSENEPAFLVANEPGRLDIAPPGKRHQEDPRRLQAFGRATHAAYMLCCSMDTLYRMLDLSCVANKVHHAQHLVPIAPSIISGVVEAYATHHIDVPCPESDALENVCQCVVHVSRYIVTCAGWFVVNTVSRVPVAARIPSRSVVVRLPRAACTRPRTPPAKPGLINQATSTWWLYYDFTNYKFRTKNRYCQRGETQSLFEFQCLCWNFSS